MAGASRLAPRGLGGPSPYVAVERTNAGLFALKLWARTRERRLRGASLSPRHRPRSLP
jgi:hypothetical protein